jgi:formamidopyrimidine-DNA glycosylase
VLFPLEGGETLAYTDPRRFGTGVVLLGDDARDDYFASRLGVEPLSPDFTTDYLRQVARNRKQPVKAFLLNQERIAGVGNIYADEALFKSRIHPERPVGTLKRAQLEALREAVIESLELGIDSRGASIDDYRNPDGAEGLFQTKFQVHLREGEPCVRCGTTIKKMRAAGRGTYVCEKCQPRPRRRPATRQPAAA